MTSLEIAGLLVPVIIVCAALLILPLVRWQDAREARKRAAKDVAPHRS